MRLATAAAITAIMHAMMTTRPPARWYASRRPVTTPNGVDTINIGFAILMGQSLVARKAPRQMQIVLGLSNTDGANCAGYARCRPPRPPRHPRWVPRPLVIRL